MAINFNNATTSFQSGGTAVTSKTFSHTTSGLDITLIVSVTTNQAQNVSGITYNGVAMSLGVSYTVGGMKVWMYYLGNCATGANNVVVSFDGSINYYYIVASSYTGTNTSSPIGNSDTGTSTGTAVSNSITTANDNSWIIDCLGVQSDGSTITNNDSQVQRANIANTLQINVADLPKATAGSFTSDYTLSTSQLWTLAEIELKKSQNLYSLALVASSSQYAYCSDNTALSITGDMTLEAYVYFTDVSGSKSIITKRTSTGNQRSYSIQHTGTNLDLSIYSDGVTGTVGTVAWIPTINVWYRLSVTYDASAGSCEFFIDGQSIGTDTGLSTSIYDSTSNFAIGALFAPAQDFFNGKVDDIRVWNDIRTAQEIADNYNIELVGNEANLVGYWKLNNDYNDSTSNGNNLTGSGSPVFSTDTPFTSSINSNFFQLF